MLYSWLNSTGITCFSFSSSGIINDLCHHWYRWRLPLPGLSIYQCWLICLSKCSGIYSTDTATTTKQSITKPRAYFIGYTVQPKIPAKKYVCHWKVDMQSNHNICIVPFNILTATMTGSKRPPIPFNATAFTTRPNAPSPSVLLIWSLKHRVEIFHVGYRILRHGGKNLDK